MPDLSPWDAHDIPPELAWRPGWWEERWIATFGLRTRPDGLWRASRLEPALAAVPRGEAVLLRLGEQWGSASPIMYVHSHAADDVAALLSDDHVGADLRARRGRSSELTRLLGPAAVTDPRQTRLNMRQGPPSAEPVLVRMTAVDGSALVRFTQQPRLLARRLAEEGRIEPSPAVDAWSVPRRGADGVIDGSALCALHRRLTATTND